MYGTARITIFHANGDVARHLRRCNDTEEIYNLLEPLVGHNLAENAARWCANAPIGDGWYDEDFEIEITE